MTKLNQNELTSIEVDTIGEVLNISMGAAATAISIMLNKQVDITTPVVSIIKDNEFEYNHIAPAVGVEINYTEGLNGTNLMIMSIADVNAIVGCLLGEDMSTETLDEIHTSALGEVMNQMMGSASTALASFFDKSINISPPRIVDPSAFYSDLLKPESGNSANIVTVGFKFFIEGLIDSQFITVLPLEFAQELVSNAINFDSSNTVEPESVYGDNVTGHTQIARPIYVEEKVTKEPNSQAQRKKSTLPPDPPREKEKKNVSVQNVQFSRFEEDGPEKDTLEQVNLDLVMGVEVSVTVEIGHTKRLIKDILNITKGSIIELDKQAGDPVDVVVNGRLVAKGDIVVIDDNFGVRIIKVLNG